MKVDCNVQDTTIAYLMLLNVCFKETYSFSYLIFCILHGYRIITMVREIIKVLTSDDVFNMSKLEMHG